ncbi:MAG: bifunctional precorrin-2 dehydrogenase/sirohydrochlorin ferrochelatase [Bacteroidota bacterium]
MQNPLYPVFIKLHQLEMLIVGAGEVGHEKLSFILKSSPEANITVVAPWVSPEVSELLETGDFNVQIIKKEFEASDLDGKDLAIAATNIKELNAEVQRLAKARKVLVNVADTPALCDFYLGSIVTRGNLKVAISTNGKSPTFAKRFRQMLEATLPVDAGELMKNLKIIRDRLTGDFKYKVQKLNAVTASLVSDEKEVCNSCPYNMKEKIDKA